MEEREAEKQEEIRKNLNVKKYSSLPDYFSSFKEAFIENFLMKVRQDPSFIFIFLLVPLFYKTAGDWGGAGIRMLCFIVGHFLWSFALASLYREKFMTRHRMNVINILFVALFLFCVLAYR